MSPSLDAQSVVTPRLSPKVFARVCELTYDICGIVLRTGKEELVQSRLTRRLRACGLGSYEAYLDLVERDPLELASMVDVLTTNKTNFFREPGHFELMKALMQSWRQDDDEIRIWSAACSSGEEPYTIAMWIWEHAPQLVKRVRILATDISSIILAKARTGTYANDVLRDVPPTFQSKYFEVSAAREVRVVRKVRDMVKFGRLNLLDCWPLKRQFRLIFCRNVMIYFDKETQLNLARRFAGHLEDNGQLFIGHSESLGTSDTGLRYIQPAVYAK